jgi:3-hydroxyacyl-[acyl-carrier-protein] dehydratase
MTTLEATVPPTPQVIMPSLPMDSLAIMALLPHRYPFLLVDRVVALEPGQHIEGLKLVSINEPFFQGHFPEKPIMPGVLQLEALAQLSGVLISLSEEGQGKMGLFAGVDNARFRAIVVPGDVLTLQAQVIKLRSSIAKMAVKALVDGKIAVEAELTISLVPKNSL